MLIGNDLKKQINLMIDLYEKHIDENIISINPSGYIQSYKHEYRVDISKYVMMTLIMETNNTKI